ncbi:MAG: hypothetical protein M5U28_21340 [Sandaracinaceae bacterium]|nr:hypothetical protein [Sandaracinaceae bacterium]MCZ7680849.1 hypothetical protein [Sandaracinaceae bacterium]MCZ7681164.1 hypothetical protein [Sandaracinaceae bacterium]MCZ7681191.1 hypothetical protein [Sandaracinaceae bacterium]
MRATAKVAQSADVDGVRAQLSQMIEQGRATEALDLVVELLTLLKDENLRLGLEVAKLMKRFVGRPGEGSRPSSSTCSSERSPRRRTARTRTPRMRRRVRMR